MCTDIRHYVETCGVYTTYADKQPTESMVMTETPDLPWLKVGTDLLSLSGKDYMVTTDYHSGFVELDYLPDRTSKTVVGKLKNNFSRHGIPHTLVKDNGQQYASAVFRKFAQNWQLVHETSRPGNSQGNGAAEAAVKIAKRMLGNCKASRKGPYLGLLNIRNTPSGGMTTSTAQRLFGRRTKTLLPITHNQLKPGVSADVGKQSGCKRKKFQTVLNSDHRRRDLRRLYVGETIRMQPLEHGRRECAEATVHTALSSDRTMSYQRLDAITVETADISDHHVHPSTT